jgi:N-acyl homoserine lactone hydrolase
MKMHPISAGRLRMRKATYLPEAEKSETIELPVSAFLIRHPQGNLLFDTGCHPAVATDAAGRWGGLAKFMTPISPPDDNLVENLRCIGIEPDDIDVVVCSHLHPDHCGCNGFFRRATFIAQRAEVEAANAPGAEGQGYIASEWTPPSPFRTFDGEHDVFGDGRVVLVHVPGHTPGMSAARVELERDGTFLLASDAVALKAHLDRDFAPKNTWSVEAALRSFETIRAMKRAGATVICGHDDAQWQRLRKGAEFYA